MRKILHFLLVFFISITTSLFADIFHDIEQGKIEDVIAWIYAESDLNVRNAEGQTTLIYAVVCKQREIVIALRVAGVDISLKDNFGKTAYDYAIEQDKQKAAIKADNDRCVKIALGVMAIIIISAVIYNYYFPQLEKENQSTLYQYPYIYRPIYHKSSCMHYRPKDLSLTHLVA